MKQQLHFYMYFKKMIVRERHWHGWSMIKVKVFLKPYGILLFRNYHLNHMDKI